MEYEKDNGVMGRVPEFGAIFMSNISTKKECFRRKLFGLPLAMANFAKQVKAGMILFLFEFERRELFGVFRATSGGVMNIVPNAFSSSGHFPAQVRFTPIWFCSPLSEHEFRDAIRENYFSAKKFNFGLSEDQVHRLLCLFSSRKLKNRLPQRQFAREVTIPFRKDRGQVDDDTISDIVGFEPDKGNYSTRSIISKSPLNSSNRVKRVDYDRFSVGNMAESEDKVDCDLGQGIWTGNAGDSWGKRRRIYDDDDNDSFFMGNVTENDRFDDRAPRQALLSECNGDSLGKERRVADDGQFLTGDRIKIKREMDNVIEPAISTDYLENSFNKARRVGVDGKFQMMDRGRIECDIDAGSRQVVLTEHHDSPLHKVKLTTDDDGFLMNNSSVENKCRRPSDVGTFLVRDRAENEHNADNSFGSVISADYSRYSLGEDRLIANDGRFRKNDKDIDNFRRPVISTDYTAFSQSTQNPLVNSSKPFIETEYSSALTRLKEVPVFDRPYHTSHDAIVTSTVPYDPEVPDIYHRQPLPFGPGRSSENAPRSFQGSNGNYWSPSKSKSTPYHSELESLSRCLDVTPGYGNKVPLPEVLPDFQKINRVSTPIRISNASNRWDRSSYATTYTLSNAGYSENREFTNSACEGYSGTLFLDPSLDYIPLSNGETCEKENNPFSYALGSIKDSSFAFNNDYPVESHRDHERKILIPENNEAPTRKEFPSPDAGGFRFGYVAKPSEAQDLYLHEKGSVDENSHYQSSGSMHCDKKNNRTSVFARLTLAPKVRVQEQENDTQVVYDKYDMDASVDDVMDLLRQSRNHQIKMRKYKPLVRRHDNDENIRAKKFFAIHNQMKYEESMMTSAKNEGDPEMTIDLNRIIEKSGEPLLEETRLVDFKRRSEIKKNLDETTTKDTVGTGEARVYVYNAESEGLFGNKSADNAEGLVGKPRKRRKLVRPAFGKEDPIDESISGDRTLNLILPSHINSLSPKNGESCENNDTPPNVESVQVTCSTSCDGNNTNAEQSSECWEKGNSDDCGDGREAPNDILNRLSDLLSMVKNRNVGGSSSNEDPVADLTSQDLGMDRRYSQAKESPIDVYDVPGNRAKCRGNEDLFQDAEKAKEICPEL